MNGAISPSRLLKKPSMAFSTSQSEKRGFRIAPIFNGLQPSKMSVALYRLAGCRKTADLRTPINYPDN
jgi:hypothetical protein